MSEPRGMTELRGMLTMDALSRAVDDERLDTVIVSFTDHYGRSPSRTAA